MNLEDTIQKLHGHSDKLHDLYLGVVRTYSVLHPMIFSEDDVCNRSRSGPGYVGFKIIRESLYFSLIQDIANLVFDNGRTNPSIVNTINLLNRDGVKKELRTRYTAPHYHCAELDQVWALNRGREFDSYRSELYEKADKLLDHPYAKAAKSMRDKLIAHRDLRFVDGNYQIPDAKEFKLKWNSLEVMIDLLKPIVDRINHVVRQTGFEWNSFECQNAKIANDYWNPAVDSNT